MLKTGFEIQHNETFQCSKCIKKKDESFREKKMGCTGKNKSFKREIDQFIFNICPGNFYNPGYVKLFETYKMYARGILAESGGLLDQPSKYISAMEYIEYLSIKRSAGILESNTPKGKTHGRK